MLYKLKVLIKEALDKVFDSTHFGESLDRLRICEERALESEGELFNVPFNFSGVGHYHSISPSQEVDEVRPLYELVSRVKPKIVCEIGTDKGGTFYLWCQASDSDATLVSVDLPTRMRYSERRRRLYSQFKKSKHQKLIFLPGDSHSLSTRRKLEDILDGRKIDFLFIDGDHSYEGVKTDYEDYSKYVRNGGLIVFHDIRTVRPGCGVKEYWEELSSSFPQQNLQEFTVNAYGPTGAGIGVIKVD